jgi:hypothetical protein
VRIRAFADPDGLVFFCYALNTERPAHPVLELSAGPDTFADDLPILVHVQQFRSMIASASRAPVLDQLRMQGRILDRDGDEYIEFPMWEVTA